MVDSLFGSARAFADPILVEIRMAGGAKVGADQIMAFNASALAKGVRPVSRVMRSNYGSIVGATINAGPAITCGQ